MLHYKQYGDIANEKILFLHGGGLSGDMWEDVVRYLESDYCCIIPDLPGHGQNTDVGPLTTENCVAQLDYFFQRFGPVHLVGLSLGGAITLRLLITRANQIQTAIISGTSAGMSKPLAILLNTVVAPIYGLLSTERMATSMMKGCNIPQHFKPSILNSVQNVRPTLVRQMYNMISDIQLPMSNQRPLLILAGELESRIVHRYAGRLQKAIPCSKSATVPSVQHVWSYESPELFAITIRLWIENRILHPDLHEEFIN